MPELLIEFFSEEIPARMQKRAGEELESALRARLADAGLAPSSMRTLSGPRRLACAAFDVPAAQADRIEEKKGPRVGAPGPAIEGFLKAAGLARIEDAMIVPDKKGDFYAARLSRPGQATKALLPDMIAAILRGFPWPKSMRSGAGDFLWVRPLHSILCVFDGAPVPFEFEGVAAGSTTFGHRFHAPGPIEVRNLADYESLLARAKVMVDREARKAKIERECRKLCAGKGLVLLEDPGLFEEVAGLAEWPVAVMGAMDPAFLDLPAEVIATSMRTHQKFFAMRSEKTGTLAPAFITIANIRARDQGRAIAHGNARVLSARLNDARFFWDSDRARPLDAPERVEKLKGLVFHEKLGSMHDKAERLSALAGDLAGACGAESEAAIAAGRLAKFDLVSEMVGEFPELQGLMGGYYAAAAGAEGEVAAAIADHYKPQGPRDQTPRGPLGRALALADKFDSLLGFWSIGEKPTGSGDPYALRRAALGILRILIEADLDFDLVRAPVLLRHLARLPAPPADGPGLLTSLAGFFSDRLAVALREENCPADLVRAALANVATEGLSPAVLRRKALALRDFIGSTAGADLLTLYRRAENIIEAERKKDKALAPDPHKAQAAAARQGAPADQALAAALGATRKALAQPLAERDFPKALQALSGLRAPLDRFFAEILVNDRHAETRLMRLGLLAGIGEICRQFADFGAVEGRG